MVVEVGDLTIRSGYMCATNEDWSMQVTGSKGNIYVVRFGRVFRGPFEFDYSCTCPAIKVCKHIKEAQNHRCGWHQQFEAGEVDPKNPKCPKCGGPVVAIRWGE